MKKLTLATFALHTVAIIIFIIGATSAFLGPIITNSSDGDGLLIFGSLCIIGISIGLEIIIFQLKKGKLWAWYTAMGIGILGIITIYPAIIGILILIGLGSKETRECYQKNINS